jgi:acyl-homoserine lactone acylase PvdQ
VPIRPDGYDWTHPVPGDTSATEWRSEGDGFHDTADLVQLLNPSTGWMQNCNISPGTMTESSPLTADRYPYYLYMASTDGSNPRGRRANELLSTTARMTLEDAVAIANDTYVHGQEPWRAALLDSYGAQAEAHPHLGEAIEILCSWNGHADRESVGMTLFRAWWLALQPGRDRIPKEVIHGGEPLSKEVQETLLSALAEAVQRLTQRFSTIRVRWGDVYRARRGDASWPISGIAGQAGLVTLRAVNGGEPDPSGISYIESGQSCTTVVMLKKGDVRSYSAVPYGQSEDPASPHYTDQGRLLFSERKLKDTWFSRERLEGHIESRQALRVTWALE